MTPSISELVELVAAMPPGTRQAFERIFSVDVVQGALNIPPQMLPWIEKQFGSVEGVTSQRVVKVSNRVTSECSIFNPLRSLRPHHFSPDHYGQPAVLQETEDDPFSNPLENTPEDPFGRIEGKHCITAGNVAKYEGYHGVVIFKNYDPLRFGCSEVADYLETAWKWAQSAHAFDPFARYFLFLWNCMNRAGASIPHGHAQVVLGRGSHYAKVEQLRRAAVAYRKEHGSDYFDDLFVAHEALGLAWQHGDARVMVYLAALKLNEVMVLTPGLTESLKHSVYRVLAGFRDRLNVTSFNVGIVFPQLGDATGWDGFPVVARMVDRGNSGDVSSDIGAMEFYGANVVSSDPFHTASALAKYFP